MEFSDNRSIIYPQNTLELAKLFRPKTEPIGMSEMRGIAQVATWHLPPSEPPLHFMPHHTFALALDDIPSLEMSFDGVHYQPYPVKAGEWNFFPNTHLVCSRWVDPVLCMHLYLLPDFLNQLGSEISPDPQIDLPFIYNHEDKSIEHFLGLFRQRFFADRLADTLYLEALAQTLGIYLIRQYSDSKQLLKRPILCDRGRDFRDMIDYIHQNLDQDLTIQELAQRMQLSMSVFGRSFRAAIGTTPHQFILDRRLEKAKKLLSNPKSELSIGQIAQLCGFATTSLFTTRFRQKYGVTPSKYRSQQK
jgi:AraC family transcriptional regulator